MEELIRARIKQFWGYGSFEAPAWFVGFEQGISAKSTSEELRPLFEATHGDKTIDMRGDMAAVADHMRWFQLQARINPTWRYFIALHLRLKLGRKPTAEEIRRFQIEALGDMERKQTAVLHLMPLQSKADEDAWLYGKIDVPGLGTRRAYIERYKPRRVKRLAALIRKHIPKLVVFNSLTYLPVWQEVVGAERELTALADGMYATASEETLFCTIPDGAASGMSYARVHGFVELLRSHFPAAVSELSIETGVVVRAIYKPSIAQPEIRRA